MFDQCYMEVYFETWREGMNTYLISYKIGPTLQEARERGVTADCMVDAYLKLDRFLSLRYPHYQLKDIQLINRVIIPQ